MPQLSLPERVFKEHIETFDHVRLNTFTSGVAKAFMQMPNSSGIVAIYLMRTVAPTFSSGTAIAAEVGIATGPSRLIASLDLTSAPSLNSFTGNTGTTFTSEQWQRESTYTDGGDVTLELTGDGVGNLTAGKIHIVVLYLDFGGLRE